MFRRAAARYGRSVGADKLRGNSMHVGVPSLAAELFQHSCGLSDLLLVEPAVLPVLLHFAAQAFYFQAFVIQAQERQLYICRSSVERALSPLSATPALAAVEANRVSAGSAAMPTFARTAPAHQRCVAALDVFAHLLEVHCRSCVEAVDRHVLLKPICIGHFAFKMPHHVSLALLVVMPLGCLPAVPRQSANQPCFIMCLASLAQGLYERHPRHCKPGILPATGAADIMTGARKSLARRQETRKAVVVSVRFLILSTRLGPRTEHIKPLPVFAVLL